jgi:hypothetical protein
MERSSSGLGSWTFNPKTLGSTPIRSKFFIMSLNGIERVMILCDTLNKIGGKFNIAKE